MKFHRKIPVMLTCLVALAMLSSPVAAAQGDVTLVSGNASGTQGDGDADTPRITPAGDYVVFMSMASNHVSPDMNTVTDIFRRQTSTGEIQIASHTLSDTEANRGSIFPDISSDGSRITFVSYASNMIPGDVNGETDVFLRDMSSGNLYVVSVDTTREAVGNSWSTHPSISNDGNRIAFTSNATNLISDDTNGFEDVFMNNISANITGRVSVTSTGDQANGRSYNPSISGNGRYVAFESMATNFVTTDENAVSDVFIRDLDTITTTLVSVALDGNPGNGVSYDAVLSDDGRYVLFNSESSNLVDDDTNGQSDLFVRDMQSGTTTRVSVSSEGAEGNGESYQPDISPDGRYVVFISTATNLIPNDTNGSNDVFMHDQTTGMTTIVSTTADGTLANNRSMYPTVSSNGAFVAFQSAATNLIASDTNFSDDIFLKETDRISPTIIFGDESVPPYSGAIISNRPNTLSVLFSENVLANGTPGAADSGWNYMLVSPGPNGVFNTTTSSGGICDSDHVPDGDDVRIFINGVTYNNVAHIATISFEQANTPLANGRYQLFVCGLSSIHDLVGNVLNTRANSGVSFTVGGGGGGPGGGGGGGGAATIAYPATGFAPGRVTNLPKQVVAYSEMDGMQLDIPALGVQMPVMEVPKKDGKWDVSWLGKDAGWLSGSAFPTWEGNSVITGHVFDANGKPGPFENLGALKWGDRVIIHSWGQDYVYEVRSVEEYVNPKDTRLLTKHEKLPWLTLVTCKGYDEKNDIYQWRTVVRAVQIEVK